MKKRPNIQWTSLNSMPGPTYLGVTEGELLGVELALPPLVSVQSVPVWLLLRRIFLGVLCEEMMEYQHYLLSVCSS